MLEGSEAFNKTLDDYSHLAVRRRWWLLLPACLVALATVGISLLLRDVYRSETVILVEQQRVPEHYVVPNITSDLRNRLMTMTQQILSRTRLLQIIDEFDLYAKERKKLVPVELVELMRRNVEVELLEGDARDELSAFKVSFTSVDPRLAQRVTERLTSLYIEENLRAREQRSQGTTKFLQAQLERASQELDRQEERLSKFKSRYVGELPEQQQGNLQLLSGLQMQLQNTSAMLNRAGERRIYLESLIAQYQSLVGAGASLPGSPAATSAAIAVENELMRLRRARATLLARYTPSHPNIPKIDHEIEQAEALLAQVIKEKKEAQSEQKDETLATPGKSQTATAIAQLQSQLNANQAEIDNLIDEEKRIRAGMRKYERRLNLTPLREQQLADVVRDYRLSRENYEQLMKKKLESELASNLEKRQQGEQFRILDPPSLPIKPDAPNRPLMNLAGGALGLGLAVGLALLIEVRDRSLYTENELRRLVPVPMVVAVPALLTAPEQQHRRWKRFGEWLVGSALVLAVLAAEVFVYWRG